MDRECDFECGNVNATSRRLGGLLREKSVWCMGCVCVCVEVGREVMKIRQGARGVGTKTRANHSQTTQKNGTMFCTPHKTIKENTRAERAV